MKRDEHPLPANWQVGVLLTTLGCTLAFLAGACTEPGGKKPPSNGDTTGGDIDTRACELALTLPKTAEVWMDETHTAGLEFLDSDIAFDRAGNAVAVDAAGNLLRLRHDGTSTVWLEGIVKRARGLAYLSTGELVIADSGLGRLIKVFPNGEVRTLVPHLDYPNGLDVDQEDQIYVTEATRGAVSQVNPTTGAMTTLAQGMSVAPNGLAFSPDYKTLYIAGAGDGQLYALTRDATGVWGALRVFAAVPMTPRPCDGKQEGDDCEVDGQAGVCLSDEAGGLFCGTVSGCYGKAEGDPCSDYGMQGTCVDDGYGGLYCRPPEPCDGLVEGDPCMQWETPGICTDEGFGLYCRPPQPCDDKEAGDVCSDYEVPGICVDEGYGLYCRPPQPCDGLVAGDDCSDGWMSGICTDDGFGNLYCGAIVPCADKVAGDECVEYSASGVCTDDGYGGLYCRMPQPCDGKIAGDSCSEYGDAGICEDYGDGNLYCIILPPCEGKVEGDSCTMYGWPGACEPVDGFADLTCVEVAECAALTEGAPCLAQGLDGTCTDVGNGTLYCRYEQPCEGAAAGDACETWDGLPGICIANDWDQTLYCYEVPDCWDLSLGDACRSRWDEAGVCNDDLWGGLYCDTSTACSTATEPGAVCPNAELWSTGVCTAANGGGFYCRVTNACTGLAIDDSCEDPERVSQGVCTEGWPGILYCAQVEPCTGQQAGDSCTTYWGTPGVCVDNDGYLYCEEMASCQQVGDPCVDPDHGAGFCEDDGYGGLICVVGDPCDGLNEGDACMDPFGREGICALNQQGALFCNLTAPCEGLTSGDSCVSLRAARAGICTAGAGGELVCQPTLPCTGKAANDPCVDQGGAGTCVDTGLGGELWCETEMRGAVLHAVNTDVCGNVYVSDASSDAIWRFSPDGTTRQLVAATLHAPITSVTWGSGVGGWDADTIYLGVAGGAGVLAVPLGVPSRPMTMPIRTDTVPTGTEPTPPVDCLHLPNAPLEVNELDNPRGYHDVAFDSEGYLIGSDGFNLVAVNYDNQSMAFALGIEGVQGMDWLPDGSLVVASDMQGLVVIAPTGAQTVVAPDIMAYGVTVAPDGLVYAANNSKIYRVDVETEAVTVYLDPASYGDSWVPRTVSFDQDYSLMFIGAFGDSVYALSIDDHFDPIGRARRLATVVPSVSFLDGLGTDACGNFYLPNYETAALYRVSPDGIVTNYWDTDLTQYGHGLEWGNGIGSWRTDALYLPQPYDENTVVELVIGVGSARAQAGH